MSSSDYGSSDQSSSSSSVSDDDGGEHREESFFGPRPWSDLPLTHQRLEACVKTWVCKDWLLRAGQFEVVKALRPSGRVFCGFPTAAGKTLIACCNALLDFASGVAGVHVICQPLQALVGQTKTKLTTVYFANTRIQVVAWEKEVTWDKEGQKIVPDIDFLDKVVVILASPEELDDVFKTCNKHRARIRALMIDEAHLRGEWPFRNYLASDQFTSKYPTAMVGIFSATLDKPMIDSLKESMALFDSVVFDQTNVPVLRALEVQRLNQLVIRCCPLAGLRGSVLAAVKELNDGDAIVVFAATYDVLSHGKDLLFHPEIAHLRPRMYAASFDSPAKEAVVEQFNKRTCRFVVSTCAFGTGVDFPKIRYVFFDHAPKSWSSFMQYAGRGGRGDFSKKVFVTMAFSPNDIKQSDRRVQVLAFYCPKSKSATAKKVKIKCPDCEEERFRPPFKDVDFTGRCFDFEGVFCDTTRQACLRTITGFFQGLFVSADLADREKDCRVCSACSRREVGEPQFAPGNKVRVKPKHVKHAGVEGIVISVGSRISFRSDDGSQHSLAATNLTLESAMVHDLAEKATNNTLDKEARIRFANLIRAELLLVDVADGSLFFSNVPNEAEIKEAAKRQNHAVLPKKRFAQLMEKAKQTDAKFDHGAGFKAFLAKHDTKIKDAGKKEKGMQDRKRSRAPKKNGK